MLNNIKTLKGYKLAGLDGDFGKIKEFYFDDKYWVIRYLVADTGNWLMGRQALISPYAFKKINKEKQHITIDLTKKQIEDSPALDTDMPVSRQFENGFYRYYGYPVYWSGSYTWGVNPEIIHDRKKWKEYTLDEQTWDPNLRSTDNVSGYRIQTTDSEVGHVEDFIIDDETWAIRYLIIDTQNFWPGKKVLVSPKWIDKISWSKAKILVNLSSEMIKESPEYTDQSLITRDYETGLHHHYNHNGHWTRERNVDNKSELPY